MTRFITFSALLIVTLLFSVPVVAATPCEKLSSLNLPNVTVTTAEQVTSGSFQKFNNLPPFCRVAATLKPSSDSDIKIEVWMPLSGWNQKFQAVGNGGGA